MSSNVSITSRTGSQYPSLRDYLRVIRQQRLVVLACTVIGVAAAVAVSTAQDPVYEAETSLAFRPPTQDIELIGLPPIRDTTPEARAAVGAEEANRPDVLNTARRELGLKVSLDDFEGMVEARAEVRTNLVVITAEAGTRDQAVAIAKAVADEVVRVERVDQRRRYNDVIRATVRERERTLRGDDPLTDVRRSQLDERLVLLRATRDFTIPVEIVEPAEAAPEPVEPKPVRNTIIGFIGGLVLGLLIAFLRTALDRKLRGVSELAEEADLPLLGVVREGALGRVNFGDVVGKDHEAEVDLESFRILRMNLDFMDVDRPVKRVLVTSPLPEEGKSTVAGSLAVAAGLAGRETLLVEGDLRRPVLSERLGIDREPGLTDYLAGVAQPQQVLRTVPLGATGSNGASPDTGVGARSITMLPAGAAVPRPTELIGSKRFAGFADEIAKAYDFVIFDSAPLLSTADTLELVQHVDAIVLCVRSDQTTRDQLRAALDALGRLPERPVGLVVTGISRGAEGDYGYYHSTYARPVVT